MTDGDLTDFDVRLARVEESVEKIVRKVDDLTEKVGDFHDVKTALLDVPPGSGPDARPLLEDIRVTVRAYQRAAWVTRVTVWAIPTAAGVGVAIQMFVSWIRKGG